MKPYLLILTVVALLCGSAGIQEAWAKDGLEIGTEVYFFNYEEPDFMENEGVFYGVNAGYTQHLSGWDIYSDETLNDPDARFLMRLDGRFAFGQVDYTSSGSGEIDNIDDYVLEGRVVAGYDFPVTEENVLTPYIGGGYRYFNDDTAGKTTTTGARGYERESNYFYLPIGVDFYAPITAGWDMTVNLEYDVFIQGEQKSHLGDAIAGLSTVTNDQEDGYGARGSVRFATAGDGIDFYLEPFVRYWHIDDSDISAVTYNGVLVGYGLEPENKTIEAGAKLGVLF